MPTKLKEPFKTHEGCRFCHGSGVETEIDVDYGIWNEVILSDPCFHCGGDGYDRVDTEEELDAAAARFAEENTQMWNSMQLSICSKVMDS